MFRHVRFFQLYVETSTYFNVSPVDGFSKFLRREGRTVGASNPLDVAMGY